MSLSDCLKLQSSLCRGVLFIGLGELIIKIVPMSQKNLYCDQCGNEASVFALQPPLKVKTCPEHVGELMEKHPSVFTIAAYNFIDQVEDYSEYIKRCDLSQKCQGSLTALQERCENNRFEAHNRL